MNSISGVRRRRPTKSSGKLLHLHAGEKAINQETRRWDDARGETFRMHIKEFAHDYRYFPDPDLLPVDTSVFMDEGRSPPAPRTATRESRETVRARLRSYAGYDASVLASEKPVGRLLRPCREKGEETEERGELDHQRSPQLPASSLGENHRRILQSPRTPSMNW